MTQMKDLSRTDLAAAADANLVTHVGWVQQRTPGMRVVDTGGLVLVDSGLPCDTFNVVCRARLAQDAAQAHVRAAVDYFAGASRPFAWWLSPADQPADLGEILCAVGLQTAETELAMAAELATLGAADLAPGGLQIRRV